MASSSTVTLGRIILSVIGLGTSIGGYIADWNETHVKNPTWPPHARFHNGQTMSMGMGLGLLTLYFTWRVGTKSTPKEILDSTFFAALTGSLYYLTGLSAIFYPGSWWADPEFDNGMLAAQIPIFSTCFVLPWVAYLLERQRISPNVEVYRAKGQ
jgi:hypothetical protein